MNGVVRAPAMLRRPRLFHGRGMIRFNPGRKPARLTVGLIGALLLGMVQTRAQSPLAIYTDALTNSFEDWSWATRNLNNSSPVHGGSKSISVTASAWQGVSFHHAEFSTGPYSNFTFWAHGGSAGGQRLQVYAEYGSSTGPAYTLPGTLPANTWQQFNAPLSALGVANAPNFNRITLQLRNDGTTGTFYLDDIAFDPVPVPALVNLAINSTQAVQSVDVRHFGINLTMWDGYFDPPYDSATISLLQEMGCLTARMPGGSLSDEYHWASNTTLTNTWQWQASFPDMVRVATNVGVQTVITVNYGTGSTNEAAGWVAYANGFATNTLALGTDQFGINWQTVGYWAALRAAAPLGVDDGRNFLRISRTAPLGFKNWEIGNECYGTWETDSNAVPHDPFTYATRARDYLQLMKAVDPTIKVGVVVSPGEDSNINNTTHSAFNPRTGQTHYGWTPVLLTTLQNLGATPDFLIHHVYPQWTDKNNPSASPDNDAALLQSTGNWAVDSADLRQQITDYFGSGGTNIELVVTENNSDAGAQGRQSTSLVNGLYYADSLSQLLKTEFRGFVWWDLRNGTDTSGYFGSNVYGWRTYGDLGVINGLNTRHPTFYAAKLMQWFARPGDKILNATSDYVWLSTCAARRANGSVALLVLNKSIITNLNAQIALTGSTPSATATIRSFGIPNDEAARTNGPPAAQDISTNNLASAGTNFTYSFPPYSMTLLTLAPAAPSLLVIPMASSGEFIFQLQGQQDVRYVIQNSSNLSAWISVSTNTLAGLALNVTNAVPPGSPMNFWRAVWQP
jgi:alpha-N-arabinofuranosidase